MLTLTNIVKNYDSGANKVEALRGVSISFRPSEFVAILGHSGCGKTTMLNIIGGLDRYTSGDLIIRGKSTKQYKDRDWDNYRNHSVGFVFQSYNLIPHQNVLANVELALTLSGVKRGERRKRAKEALEKVGLGDQLHKKPNQLSGGQMQRVAIARALVNNPEILLADEPTGALDSDTSVQIMDILREVAKDRLVIMVTHNPELADQYASRIVRLQDGKITSDSNPYDGQEEAPSDDGKKKRASMSLLTAFMLSLSNLMTKKGRTIMTAFAGSIGIVGIALILSISTGINQYIEDVEKDTLSSYPITLQESAMDMSSMMTAMSGSVQTVEKKEDTIYSQNVMSGMMDMMFAGSTTNNLAAFKEFIETGDSGLEALTSEIRYTYSTPLNVYRADTSSGVYRVNPSSVFENLGMSMGSVAGVPTATNMDVWAQLTTNEELLNSQYIVEEGRMPEAWNEVVLILDKNGCITDYTLYSLGVLDMKPLQDALQQKLLGEDVRIDTTIHSYSYFDFIGMKFKLLPTTDYYQKENGVWVDKSQDPLYMTALLSGAEELTIVGVVKPSEDSSAATSYGVVGYTGALMEHLIGKVAASQVVADQKANPDLDIFSGLPFADPNAELVAYTMDQIMEMIPAMTPDQQMSIQAAIAQMKQAGMNDEQIAAALSQSMAPAASSSNYDTNMTTLGVADLADPSGINLYPIDFEAKDEIAKIIAGYNKGKDEENQIIYTDFVGQMMSSVTTIINAISYILIAFVAISLVVSSIMIGVITNISVLERTKEIGILRSVGASKRDVSHVFNAETMLVGLAAGLVGILITELLIIPINLLIKNIAGIDAQAVLPPVAALILILISVLLTSIAGLIPASSAAKKDPVVALRTE